MPDETPSQIPVGVEISTIPNRSNNHLLHKQESLYHLRPASNLSHTQDEWVKELKFLIEMGRKPHIFAEIVILQQPPSHEVQCTHEANACQENQGGLFTEWDITDLSRGTVLIPSLPTGSETTAHLRMPLLETKLSVLLVPEMGLKLTC